MKFFDTLTTRPLFDPRGVSRTIEQALDAAGLDTRSGTMKDVAETIRRALASAGMVDRPDDVIDVSAHEVPEPASRSTRPGLDRQARTDRAPSGQFLKRSFSNQAGTREYKLYVPACYAGEPLPLVVMLHGCTQDPDDFAAGTRMNELAERHGFLVVYPAQAPKANGSRCWNWFKAQDQQRDRGEPSLIAGITREVVSNHRVDARRVFVAGLSAGAAMAVVMGETYPELYVAVGAHSGLPYAAAHDVPSAFAAMHGSPGMTDAAPARRPRLSQAVPTIVFHGDQDTTVGVRNGIDIVGQARAQAVAGGADETAPLRTVTQQGIAPGGRSYSRTQHLDAADRCVVEQWVVHGAGHAWFGGSPRGSYTDAKGPDASAEMVRFFLSQERAGTA